jgi:WD40 repeat protein
VPDLAVDPAGERFVSVDGGVIRVREIATGRLVISIYTDGSVPEIAISPDGRMIAAARSGGLVQLYDLQTGELAWERALQPNSEPWTLAFGPDGDVLASGWRNGAICWQDTQDPDRLNCAQAHTRPVGVVRFRPDGLVMLSGGYDGWLRFWSVGP